MYMCSCTSAYVFRLTALILPEPTPEVPKTDLPITRRPKPTVTDIPLRPICRCPQTPKTDRGRCHDALGGIALEIPLGQFRRYHIQHIILTRIASIAFTSHHITLNGCRSLRYYTVHVMQRVAMTYAHINT